MEEAFEEPAEEFVFIDEADVEADAEVLDEIAMLEGAEVSEEAEVLEDVPVEGAEAQPEPEPEPEDPFAFMDEAIAEAAPQEAEDFLESLVAAEQAAETTPYMEPFYQAEGTDPIVLTSDDAEAFTEPPAPMEAAVAAPTDGQPITLEATPVTSWYEEGATEQPIPLAPVVTYTPYERNPELDNVQEDAPPEKESVMLKVLKAFGLT